MKLNVKSSYDKWSETYDSAQNKTRDLDEEIIKTLLPFFTNNIIVEAGCGTGKNTKLLYSSAKYIYALDFSEQMLRKAKEKISSANVEFILQDLSRTWKLQNSFADIVLIDLVLEHIKNIRFIFSEAFRVLKEKGILFVNEYHPEKQLLGKKANFIQPGEELPVQIDAFTHTKEEYIKAASDAGFRKIELKDWYDKDDNSVPRILSIKLKK